jgi:hypothetical protein
VSATGRRDGSSCGTAAVGPSGIPSEESRVRRRATAWPVRGRPAQLVCHVRWRYEAAVTGRRRERWSRASAPELYTGMPTRTEPDRTRFSDADRVS